ncbi:hypothetical protein T11_10903 [Trichinella zimbabwensis]|uniref:Peptidase aspartic putative domain-containing protein n=1 Tax=Trichinella zimbabwensis TaxID=268475 RepID=A0A0V1GUG0_9BILA|nr:hypothetical protein T11_10903 [Trichinella zimbabwensis]
MNDGWPERHLDRAYTRPLCGATLRMVGQRNVSHATNGGPERAPEIKKLSIPRLELMVAALLCARLVCYVRKDLALDVEICHCWSDSKVALGWINGDANRWKPFVANRVREVQALTPPQWWRYCPSEDNPADRASQGDLQKFLHFAQLQADTLTLGGGRSREFEGGEHGNYVVVSCLLDTGSEGSFIRKDLADALGLTRPYENVCLVTVGGNPRTERVWPPSVKAARMSTCHPSVLQENPATSRRLQDWPHLDAVLQQDQLKERSLVVDVLIGLDHYFKFVSDHVRRGKTGGPVAVETLLSWVVWERTGPLPTGKVAFLLTKIEDSADATLRKIWET